MTTIQLEIIRLAGDNKVDREVLTQYAPLIEPLVVWLLEEGDVSNNNGN